MYRTLLLGTLLALGAFGPVASQEALVTPGTRVRIWTQAESAANGSGPVVKGRLDVLTSDSLVLNHGPRRGVSVVPLSTVSRLEVQAPLTRPEATKYGALIGGLGGAVNGVWLGLLFDAMGAEYYPNAAEEEGVSSLYFTVPVAAAIGAAGGALIGAAFPGALGKRWLRVPPASLPRTSLTCHCSPTAPEHPAP